MRKPTPGPTEEGLALPCRRNTLAVTVAFYPEAALADNLRAALTHVERVLLVDNTPTQASPPAVREAEAIDGVEVVRLGRNAGVAAALNIGLAAMHAGRYAWLLTLDQDTLLLPHYSDTVRAAAAAAGPDLGLLGVNFDINGAPAVPTGPGARAQEVLITSGTLLRAECAAACGPFRSDYFIDAVDIEYALRARRRGFEVWLALAIGMVHEMGKGTEHVVLGRRRRTSNYPPSRLYYVARNGLVTLRDYARSEPTWVRGEAKRLAYVLGLAVLVEGDRRAKGAAILRGLADGLRGKMGALPSVTGGNPALRAGSAT